MPGGPLLRPASCRRFERGRLPFRAQLALGQAAIRDRPGDYHFRHEPILYGWLENGAHYFIEDRSQDRVFQVDKPHVSDLHPTTKPVELIARMIANSSRPGEIVYDPFCGSGSTLLAAHQLERVGYGIEIDPGYVAVTLERLCALGLKPQLLEEVSR